MGHVKTLVIVLMIMLVPIALAGCTSSSSGANTEKPMVVATVTAPTPAPTDPPTPTPRPTYTPTPTPTPAPITLMKINITGVLNPDQRAISNDPNQTLTTSTWYAVRQDTAKITVKNTGDSTLKNLNIIYENCVSMTAVDTQGHYSTTVVPKNVTSSVGTLNPGDSKDLTLQPPLFEANQEVTVNIFAQWDGGSLELYSAKLKPSFSGSTSSNMADMSGVMMYGSANN